MDAETGVMEEHLLERIAHAMEQQNRISTEMLRLLKSFADTSAKPAINMDLTDEERVLAQSDEPGAAIDAFKRYRNRTRCSFVHAKEVINKARGR